jgi:hypothetical protein
LEESRDEQLDHAAGIVARVGVGIVNLFAEMKYIDEL